MPGVPSGQRKTGNKYLLLNKLRYGPRFLRLGHKSLGKNTEFEGRIVSYGPSAKRGGHKSKGKKRGSVNYGTDRENEVSKIFIITLQCV